MTLPTLTFPHIFTKFYKDLVFLWSYFLILHFIWNILDINYKGKLVLKCPLYKMILNIYRNSNVPSCVCS